MSQTTKILSVLCLLIGIGLVGVASTTAQFDRCLTSFEEIKYGDEVTASVASVLPKLGDGIYCFDGKRGDPVIIKVEVTQGNALLNVSLRDLSNLTFEPLDNDISIDGTVTLRYVLPADGAYHITVSRLTGSGSTRYKLTLESPNAPNPTATPRPTATAAPTLTAAEAAMPCAPGAYILIPGYESEFFINPESITQTYCLYGRIGAGYGITVEGIQGTLDPMVIVYSSGFKSILASNNNAEDGETQAYTQFRAGETAIYPIVIARSGFNTGISEGIYRVTVENITKPGPESCPRAFQIPDTGLSIKAMSQSGLHTFCVDGKEGQEITLAAEAQRGNLAMTVNIIEPNWETVGTTTSVQKTLELTAALEKDQPYYILVFDHSSAGGFDLTLTQK